MPSPKQPPPPEPAPEPPRPLTNSAGEPLDPSRAERFNGGDVGPDPSIAVEIDDTGTVYLP